MSQPTAPEPLSASEREDAQVSRLLTWLSATAIVLLAGIGAKAWFAEHTTHAWVLWFFIGLIAINMLAFARTGNRVRRKAGLIVVVGLLFTYLMASGGESNTGPLWFYVFPPLLFYLTDLKTGTAVLLFCYLVAVVVFQFPGLPMVSAEYSTDFKIRFFSTLTFESIFCFVLEASRLKARHELLTLAESHERAARTDELTGLANRRDMHNRLSGEFSRYQRSGHHFSIALIDLDLFKKINDRYGHDAGDQVLREFSALMQTVIRQTDVAGRWGGEEFLILLPDTSLLQALTLAERLRSEVARHPFRFGEQALPVTISAGVCSIAKAGSLDDLLKQADLNLYAAKEAGRNRIAPRVRTQEEEGASPTP
ncbi:diguanylate cyclase (GGDEF) domain-containing protein [Marinobacter gudaonensis]|uniref:diguanylate cyclase n=1 Tax=Marinobacter gudaonensis TaxID=375760 RepID=A0A1I6GY63_9GAMM|nr:GGDEF domain-containing protein [Marinobacter gudaonensis]SFR47142.1 diguanylate cyclase (GGDEF) domain-containing protein [Marinobacter gudaonensis]